MSSVQDSSDPSEARRIVITQSTLFSIGGSEMVAFELAQYFSALGDDVMVVTFGIGRDWANELAALDGVAVIRFDDPDLDRAIREFRPTICWVHHEIIPSELMRSPAGIRFIFHHMSIIHPMEFPIAHRIERSMASAIVFVSPEALATHVESGVLNAISPEKLRVFGNPAPRYFSRSTQPRQSLKSVLLVSNHAPAELSEALEGISASCDVMAVGENNELESRIRRITPSDFDSADAVVSIGKTVQFGLVTGTPVYCYDHFGGPGWLNESNFELARFHNFSGRGFERKSSAVIRDELINGYEAALRFAAEIHVKHDAEFRLDHVVEELLASSPPHSGDPIDHSDLTSHLWELELRNGLMNAIEARRQTIEYLEGQLAAANAENAALVETALPRPSLRQRVQSRLGRGSHP